MNLKLGNMGDIRDVPILVKGPIPFLCTVSVSVKVTTRGTVFGAPHARQSDKYSLSRSSLFATKLILDSLFSST